MIKYILNPSFLDIFPDAIGLFFVLLTFLSYFLSTISFTIHPADLIKIAPVKIKKDRKNNISLPSEKS